MPCSDCNGKGFVKCEKCAGAGLVICPKCSGTGYLTGCQKCGDKRKIQCGKCGGSGKLESEKYKKKKTWRASLESFPVDRLRFEYEKRQREVGNLQTKTVQLAAKEAEISEWYDREYEHAANHFYLSEEKEGPSYPAGLVTIPAEIVRLEERIEELEDEMHAIDQVLSKKWK